MTGVLLYGYLGGWIVTSLVVAVAGSRLQVEKSPSPHPRLMSLVAGAAWPVLVVALAEAGAVALSAGVLRDDRQLIPADA